MGFFKEIILPAVGVLLLCFITVFIICFSAYKYDVEIGRANIIKIYRDEELIYEGKQAFININSGGMTTTITVYKKLFPFEIVDKTYSDNNIIIISGLII